MQKLYSCIFTLKLVKQWRTVAPAWNSCGLLLIHNESQMFSCCIWQAFCWICRTPILACRAGVFAVSMYSSKFCKSGGLSCPKKAVWNVWQPSCYTDEWVGGQFLQRDKCHFSNFERGQDAMASNIKDCRLDFFSFSISRGVG